MLDQVAFYLTLVCNALLFSVCVSASNRMTKKTCHLIRIAVAVIAAGAVHNLAAVLMYGRISWLLPAGALLLLVAERRAGIEQLMCVFKLGGITTRVNREGGVQ